MLYILILIIHVLVAFSLIGIILLQGGRGGLGETLAGGAAQSLFGGGANIVMTKITAVGAGLFMVTCLTLALLSTARGRSVVERLPVAPPPITAPEAIPTTDPGFSMTIEEIDELPSDIATPAPSSDTGSTP